MIFKVASKAGSFQAPGPRSDGGSLISAPCPLALPRATRKKVSGMAARASSRRKCGCLARGYSAKNDCYSMRVNSYGRHKGWLALSPPIELGEEAFFLEKKADSNGVALGCVL